MDAYHEITLGEVQLLHEAFLFSISSGAFDLVVIVVQSNNVHAGELSDLSRWSANTTADI